ncbi:thiamine pyrophosphate-binding protein [Oceanispirochaeta crateris]|uniref:Thiamine pyrophosphate-binding protein n=1 Tax=Oceanispirochaeta crateris TaxID=2518645 RepID=A0A5C1QRP5_9SPIO|nr:thiamine pyrophosphate-binding protein [Oceanispirochaeta crateris]QEN09650.1 thiamine pyrophosphate-binding protein [Oceanispirochaeta crateris]
MSTVADRVIERLQELGIRYVFGVPSGSWLYYMEAMRKKGIEFILVSNETSAGFMADVTYRLTGIPGACYATVGPGATNLGTGVGGALLDRSAIIAFTSEPPEKMQGRTVQMAIDQQALFRPLTKFTTSLKPETIDQVLQKAVRIAISDTPGPVHIGLPEDLGPIEVPDSQESIVLPVAAEPFVPNTKSLYLLEKQFCDSHRPVLAVGLSAVRSKAGALIVATAERHGIPVVLTPMAKGMISEDHPLYAGVLFHALSDRVAETYSQADLVIGVGYDPVEFNYESWMPEVPLIHLDTVPADIDRIEYPAVTDVIGDINAALSVLTALDPINSEWDLNALVERKNAMFQALEPAPGSFGSRAALSILRDVLPQDGIMTCGVGAHTHLIGQMWRTPAPGLQIMSNGWSSMGFGIPAAIAAKLSMPDRKVVCVTGDGGLLMMAGEMVVAQRQNLSVVFVILVDHMLELIRLKQDKKSFPFYKTDLDQQETPRADSIFGVPVLHAESADEYRSVLEKAFSTEGPVIVEARIEGGDYDNVILRKHK